ncbi:hypothetical protein [Umezawaea sp. Da 62-37]|nr:hypothetical protein [Umezawaea sp. Da 62-37]WNV91251.1 hypothetical protein RM788_24140 [Umezawaea sp. Da 62-37]
MTASGRVRSRVALVRGPGGGLRPVSAGIGSADVVARPASGAGGRAAGD